MLDLALHVDNNLIGIALEPAPIKLFGYGAELNDEIVREVLGFDLAALLAPQTKEGSFILPHNNPRVRSADETAPVIGCYGRLHSIPLYGGLSGKAKRSQQKMFIDRFSPVVNKKCLSQ